MRGVRRILGLSAESNFGSDKVKPWRTVLPTLSQLLPKVRF
jgi:hypothetical protein